MQKQARQLNIESGSKRFIDAVKCFWMPRLLQKMEQNNSSPISDHSSMTNMNNFGNSLEASTSNSISTSFNVPSQRGFIDASSGNHSSTVSTSFNNPSLDFFQFSQPLEISETSKSVPNMLENNVYNNCQIQDNFYTDDTNYNYGLEGLCFDPLSSMENYDFSQFEFQTSGNGWMLDNMANSTFWNMDAV